MTRAPRPAATILFLLALATPLPPVWGQATSWKPSAAASYLDERETEWLAFAPANRGKGTTQTTCVSCHAVLPYALARPALRTPEARTVATESETTLLNQTRARVANWTKLDSDDFALLYDFNDQKKRESWGTEAVLNAVILAFDDHYQDRSSPSDASRQAFANLWAAQIEAGDRRGSWEWLNFGMGPWEGKESPYFGAALAAIAVGTAPGYYKPGRDAEVEIAVARLRDYLKAHAARQDLHNQAWLLWASARVNGILTRTEKRSLIDRLLGAQRDDGGWSLPALGAWKRSDGTPQDASSDGYATGLVLHVLQTAGVPRADANVARGLDWLKSHQTATGAWRAVSVNKKRDPASHAGKFMSDAATAYAVLALSH
jgi:hypothetical protein